MFSRALSKSIPNPIKSYSSLLAYKVLQYVITENDDRTIMEYILIHSAPHIDGKEDDIQKKIYNLNVIPGEYPAYFIIICALLHKKIFLSNK